MRIIGSWSFCKNEIYPKAVIFIIKEMMPINKVGLRNGGRKSGAVCIQMVMNSPFDFPTLSGSAGQPGSSLIAPQLSFADFPLFQRFIRCTISNAPFASPWLNTYLGLSGMNNNATADRSPGSPQTMMKSRHGL